MGNAKWWALQNVTKYHGSFYFSDGRGKSSLGRFTRTYSVNLGLVILVQHTVLLRVLVTITSCAHVTNLHVTKPDLAVDLFLNFVEGPVENTYSLETEHFYCVMFIVFLSMSLERFLRVSSRIFSKCTNRLPLPP